MKEFEIWYTCFKFIKSSFHLIISQSAHINEHTLNLFHGLILMRVKSIDSLKLLSLRIIKLDKTRFDFPFEKRQFK